MDLFKVLVASIRIVLLKIVSSLFYCIVFCYVLLCSCYSVDVVEVAPPGAAEDHRSCSDMRTKDHPFCCTCVCLCRVPNSCETFFSTVI